MALSARISRFTDTEAETAPAFTDFTPSAYQQDIFNWFKDGYGNLIVRARAGTGKSTTILRAIDYAPESSILLAAFNKRIADELNDRLTNPNATACTLHSIGYKAIREQLNGAWCRVNDKRFAREDDLATRVSAHLPFGGKRLVAKLTTKARELQPTGATVLSIIEMAAVYGLLPPPDSLLTLEAVAQAVLRALDLAATREPIETGIDYADMIFLPLRLGLLRPEYEMVVVDEAQDMTAPQLRIAQGVAESFARIVVVGDDRQAIYQFRGADSKSLDHLKETLEATELPLSRTYRCPKRVVAIAQKYVSDFEVDDSALEGTVDSVGMEDLVGAIGPGDFVLSRINAPLASIAMSALRAKKRVRIMGRDSFGRPLVTLVKDLAKGGASHSIPAFLSKLTMWEEKQTRRLLAADLDEKVELIADQANTLRALAMGAESVPALTARIEYLFADDAEAEATVCSTVHKAKGLETSRVFVLRGTFLRPAGCTCGHRHVGGPCRRCACLDYKPDSAKMREEENLMYVAVTRAKQHLTWVEG